MRQYNKVYLEITNRCNLRCSFCPGTRRPPRTMSPAEFRLLAEKLRPATRYLYLHLMGEPLLHPELPALLAIAGELDFLVNITTNGTLLPQVGEALLAAPAVRKVSISLHSLEANDSRVFSAYLGSCISFAKRAAAAGKLTGLRLWNLDGSLPGQNDLNAPMLEELHRAFPGEWPPVREGHKIAERTYLEFGERFEWPDLSAGEREGDAFCYGLRDQFGVLCDGTVVPCCWTTRVTWPWEISLPSRWRRSFPHRGQGQSMRAFRGGKPGRSYAGNAAMPAALSADMGQPSTF